MLNLSNHVSRHKASVRTDLIQPFTIYSSIFPHPSFSPAIHHSTSFSLAIHHSTSFSLAIPHLTCSGGSGACCSVELSLVPSVQVYQRHRPQAHCGQAQGIVLGWLFTSVGDTDPQDPHVFGPPGSGSTSQRYVSGSFPFPINVLSGLKKCLT